MNLRRGRIRILLFGKDGRTDAIAAALTASGWDVELYVCTQYASPGLVAKSFQIRSGLTLDGSTLPEMVDFAREVKPDLVIVGPEEPLAAGLVDEVRRLQIPCVGPPAALAAIETSKAWTRELVSKTAIDANPDFRIFRSTSGLLRYLEDLKEFVVKPDGLTGGKGVRVSGDHLSSAQEGFDYARHLLEQDGVVVIEEKLVGEEFSLQSLTDGRTVVHCPIVQDHKRARDNDEGPNTGGMGSYSCEDGSLPFLTADDVAKAQQINEQVVEALQRETGEPYIGVLYGGFIATSDGVRLIEYNARFGDPEAMNILPIMATDFVDVCLAMVSGNLGELEVAFESRATVCKYIVPKGYPDNPSHGDLVSVSPQVLTVPDLHCYWAAAESCDGGATMTGSRALAFVGVGATVAEAERLAQRGVESVSGEVFYRRDIGTRAAIEKRIAHMHRLRNS